MLMCPFFAPLLDKLAEHFARHDCGQGKLTLYPRRLRLEDWLAAIVQLMTSRAY